MKQKKKLLRFNMQSPLNRLVVIVLILGAIVFPVASAFAAGTMTAAKLTLGDPRPTTSATDTFTFTPGSATTVKSVKFLYCDSAIGTCTPGTAGSNGIPAGIITNTAGSPTVSGLGSGGAWTTDGTPSTGQVIISNASNTGAPSAASVALPTITNQSATGTFWIRMSTFDTASAGGTLIDTLTIAATTAGGVLISATVNPSLTFAVAGLGNSATVKGAITTEAAGAGACATSTATAVSFPTNMIPNTNYTCGQSLTTTTNASSGYSVVLRGTHASGDFLKGSPTTLTITDGSGSNAAPAAFGTPTEEFAYTSSDGVLSSGTTTRFAADDTFAKVGNNSATTEEVAFNGAPVNAEVINIAYKLRFAGTTEASVYTGTVLYTCTATF
jgi:hypothetical protein